MCNDRLLPVGKPIITTTPDDTNYLSVLSTIPSSVTWIYSNYIHLAGRKNFSKANYPIFFSFGSEFMGRSFLTCPWIKTNIISTEILGEDVLNTLLYYIDIGYYVSIDVNQRYLPCFEDYMKYDHLHTIFIYGYNAYLQTLHVAGFFKKGKYSFETISYGEFRFSYEHRLTGIKADNMPEESVILFKAYSKRRNVIQNNYQLNLPRIADSIDEYLGHNNHNTITYDKRKFLYGVDIYTELTNHIRMVEEGVFDLKIKTFHVLYQHKLLMQKRIAYICEKYNLPEGNKLLSESTEVCTTAASLLNLSIKYTITKSKNILNRIGELLIRIEDKERIYLPHFTEALHQICECY